MKVDYRIPLQVIANSLQHYYQITVQMEETGGSDFFPTIAIEAITDGSSSNILRFNPQMRVLLSLYNEALESDSITADAIIHYALFQACMDTAHYQDARFHLEAFRKEMSRTKLASLLDKKQEENGFRLLMQQYFTLYHESFHLIWHYYPESGNETKEKTRQLLLDIKEEWTDGLLLINEEELYLHPKLRQHLANLIPQELDEQNRQLMQAELDNQWASRKFSPDYIDRVIQEDSGLIEEITCDRFAWINLLSMLENEGATEQDIRQVHLWLFSVFYAMDFNKVILSQFVPSIRERISYNEMRTLIRHKAFKNLLLHYSPKAYDTARPDFLKLSTGLEAVYRSSVMALFRYGDELAQFHADYQAGIYRIDFTQHKMLQKEMSVITPLLQ